MSTERSLSFLIMIVQRLFIVVEFIKCSKINPKDELQMQILLVEDDKTIASIQLWVHPALDEHSVCHCVCNCHCQLCGCLFQS